MTDFLTEELIYKKSPQEITSMLYEACIDNLEGAISALKKKDYFTSNKLLKKSNDILYRLDAGINYEAGIIADQLDALYDYMSEKLIEANIKKDVSAVEEVLKILTELSTSWSEALKNKSSVQPNTVRQKNLAYEKHILTMN
ncbi:flagellar export chaperone FliS [Cytobacillus firmus]|uniref:Putative flagellar biosynthesis protein FliS n=1 Tax=Cytobacillus firmus TaxID=1399 RepID=A0A800MYY0_CYTFI|nr:flagellar export chaperone FliS [Cytobacillus firmus]KAF0825028.1 putative flagellar biosynthesis protein FliS [Cytobacillus firmus]